ncbi:MAG: formate dehydrogenase subunit delta [Pseudonocardia sp.]
MPEPAGGSAAGTGEPPHVRLVNDVSRQFRHRPADVASAEIAGHLRTFWDPRMRAALLAHVDAGGAGLDPLAVRAARSLRP